MHFRTERCCRYATSYHRWQEYLVRTTGEGYLGTCAPSKINPATTQHSRHACFVVFNAQYNFILETGSPGGLWVSTGSNPLTKVFTGSLNGNGGTDWHIGQSQCFGFMNSPCFLGRCPNILTMGMLPFRRAAASYQWSAANYQHHRVVLQRDLCRGLGTDHAAVMGLLFWAPSATQSRMLLSRLLRSLRARWVGRDPEKTLQSLRRRDTVVRHSGCIRLDHDSAMQSISFSVYYHHSASCAPWTQRARSRR